MIHLNNANEIYFIDVKSGKISQEAPEQGGHFRILADNQEYNELKAIADRMYHDELKTYVRSHIPFIDYDTAEKNDEYDNQLIKLYGKIYELGDEETRNHIESMNILSKSRLNDKKDF